MSNAQKLFESATSLARQLETASNLPSELVSERRQQVLGMYFEALVAADEQDDRELFSQTHHAIADGYLQSNQYEEAYLHYRNALQASDTAPDQKERGRIFNSLCNLHRSLGLMNEAHDAAQQALRIFRKLDMDRAVAIVLQNLAAILIEQHHSGQAVTYLNQAIAIFRAMNNRKSLGVALGDRAAAYTELGERLTALEDLKEAIQIAVETSDTFGEAQACATYGILLSEQGDTAGAREMYGRALRLFLALGDRRMYAVTLGNLANLDCMHGFISDSITSYQQSLQILREIGDRRSEAFTLSGLSEAYVGTGEFDAGQQCKRMALDIFRGLNQYSLIGSCECEIGEIALETGDVLAAFTHLDSGLERMDHRSDTETGYYYNALYLETLVMLKQLPNAEDVYNEMQQFSTADFSPFYQIAKPLTEAWFAFGTILDNDYHYVFTAYHNAVQMIEQLSLPRSIFATRALDRLRKQLLSLSIPSTELLLPRNWL